MWYPILNTHTSPCHHPVISMQPNCNLHDTYMHTYAYFQNHLMWSFSIPLKSIGDWPEWGTSYTCKHQTSKANLYPTWFHLDSILIPTCYYIVIIYILSIYYLVICMLFVAIWMLFECYLVACQRHVCNCIVIAGCPMLPHSMLLPSVPILFLPEFSTHQKGITRGMPDWPKFR